MELGWACSLSVWLLFLGSLALRLLRADLPPSRLLLLRVGLLAVGQALGQAVLPLPLSAALTGAACWLVSASSGRRKRIPAGGKAVVVTGCDSGFGKAAAQHLDRLGLTVYASVLDLKSSGAEELRQTCSPRLTLLEMDLTKAEDIQRALKFIKAQTGRTGLWGLVNNAGFNQTIANVELTPLPHFRACMEVNFFGPLELTKGLLPLLRSSRGRIVTVSSPAGGSCNPEYWKKRKDQLLAALPDDLLEAYGEEYLEEINRQFVDFMKMAVEDLSSVVDSITDGLLSPRPLLKYYPGRGLWLMYFIHHYLPHTVRDLFLKAFFINPDLPRGLCPKACHAQKPW